VKFLKLLRQIFFRWNLAWTAWILLAMFGMGITSIVRDAQVQAACLARGYPDSHVTWNFRGYCTRRVNQTDEVLLLP
jgi:hypothetical protein